MMSDRSFRRLRLLAGLILGGLALSSLPGGADTGAVLEDFAAARYEQARDQLQLESSQWRPGEEILWRIRLAEEPLAALALAAGPLQDDDLPDPLRLAVALDAAMIHFGRGEYRDAYLTLRPWLQDQSPEVPGTIYLRAALALRALDQGQQARELLASVRPEDPAFAAARYYLGDIALDQGDPSLALRYLAGAEEAFSDRDRGTADGARWLALRAVGDTLAADELQRDLRRRRPDALANLEIRQFMPAAAAETPVPAEVTSGAAVSGRFCLQYGAFSDRSLALAFVQRHRTEIPDLRIDRERGPGGQSLYKVRSGAFNNPALARTEAGRLAETLGLDVFVTEVEGPDGPRE